MFVGLFLKDVVEAAFSSLFEVAIEFMITGFIVLYAQKLLDQKNIPHPSKDSALTMKQSLLIGIAQAIAIFPAISRSGATVATALHLKIDRETAFRFSFLLSIPAILGASVLSLLEIMSEGFPTTESVNVYIVGSIFAFIFGLVSLLWFKKVMKSAQLKYFGYYCCGISIILLTYQFLK